MVMGWIWTGLLSASILASFLMGRGHALAAAAMEGAQSGIQLAISMAGSVCLWTGVGKMMEQAGLTARLSRLIRPILKKVFPSSAEDHSLAGSLSANICANFLGLGNAATPMGIQAAKHLAAYGKTGAAGDELCRLVVLNTASIQLIPATVAAVRVSCGCATPFDILPAVWMTSICSAGVGLLTAGALGRVWK